MSVNNYNIAKINTVKIDCCGATEGSEQQHNQDLKEIYKGRRILEFITFYHNALHLTTLFTTMHCIQPECIAPRTTQIKTRGSSVESASFAAQT